MTSWCTKAKKDKNREDKEEVAVTCDEEGPDQWCIVFQGAHAAAYIMGDTDAVDAWTELKTGIIDELEQYNIKQTMILDDPVEDPDSVYQCHMDIATVCTAAADGTLDDLDDEDVDSIKEGCDDQAGQNEACAILSKARAMAEINDLVAAGFLGYDAELADLFETIGSDRNTDATPADWTVPEVPEEEDDEETDGDGDGETDETGEGEEGEGEEGDAATYMTASAAAIILGAVMLQ